MHEMRNPSDIPAPRGGWYSHTAAVPTSGGRLLFVTGPPPTSTTVEVSRLFRPEAVIEVDVVAAVGGTS